MTEKKIASDNCVFAFKKGLEPALKIKSGSEVTLITRDCFSNQLTGNDDRIEDMDWDRINPATGPVYIEEAEPGDILKINIIDIKLADQAVMITAPGEGVLGHRYKESKTKILPIKNDKVEFSPGRVYDIEPMVGVIGVAPANDEEISTGTPGRHGGNMDCKLIRKRAALYLPVNTPGALLAAGDMHALMGDGEIVVCGAEVSGEVKLKIEVLKNRAFPLPLVENSEVIATIASAKTLDEAVDQATEKMADLLVDNFGFDIHEAGMLLSIVGNAEICQVVDPLKTARFSLTKSELNLSDWQQLTSAAIK